MSRVSGSASDFPFRKVPPMSRVLSLAAALCAAWSSDPAMDV